MQRSLFVLGLAALFSQHAYAERVNVTGKRIWPEVHSIYTSGGPNEEEGPHGCSRPNCGEIKDDPIAGKGGRMPITKAQKKAANQKAVTQAQQRSDKKKSLIKDNVVQKDLYDYVKGLLSVFSYVDKEETQEEFADGRKFTKKKCSAGGSPEAVKACTQVKIEPVPVTGDDGVTRYEAGVTYQFFDENCSGNFMYVLCAPEEITFTFGSPEEAQELFAQF